MCAYLSVAEEKGEVIATGSLVDGEILGVFVHPDHQQAGLGKALMKILEDIARASGATDSLLSVSRPSKRFYEGLGYEVVEECSKDVGEGQHLDFWRAKKRLTPLEHSMTSHRERLVANDDPSVAS